MGPDDADRTNTPDPVDRDAEFGRDAAGLTPGRVAANAVGLAVAGALLFAVSRYSFPVFHGLIELFAASVALAIFFVTWHTRRFLDNHYVGIVGMAYLGVAVVGVLHTLAYKGTGIFPGGGSDLPTQLWLADRYIAAFAFLIAPAFVKRRADLRVALAISSALSAALVIAIFSGAFPNAFVEGAGLTPFKVVSEYAVIVVLAIALGLLVRVRSTFAPRVWHALAASIVMSAAAELAFTLYADPFGPANLGGHLLYAGASYLVYRALVHTTLEDPYSLLFLRLKQREAELERANTLSEGLTRIVSGIASNASAEAVMQRVVVLAAGVIGSDAAALSVPEDGEWVIRYVLGHRAGSAGTRLTVRQSAHLGEAVRRGDVIAIADTEASAVVDRSLMRENDVRSTLTVPLMVREAPVAALSFHFRAPRTFGEIEMNFARKLGAAVALAVENAELYQTEHEIAETLQAGLRPQLERVRGVDAGSSYMSAPGVGRLGGDFFDVFAVSDDRVAFMIGDVSGKGIMAATTTATVRGAARALAYRDPEPVQVLSGLNETLSHRGIDAGFVTLLYGTLDIASGLVRLGVAGHPVPWVCGRDEQPDLTHVVDPPLGLFPDRTYHSAEVRLVRGDTLVMYTDGLLDARGEGVPFGEEGVQRVLANDGRRTVDDIAAALTNAAVEHADGRLVDDVAVLALRYAGR
jgi:serine phosphatase RsbU (regulator of sigma subunit)